MLNLSGPEAVEVLLITVLKKIERVEEAKGCHGTGLLREVSREGGGGLADLGGSKGGGRAGEESDGGELHVDCY